MLRSLTVEPHAAQEGFSRVSSLTGNCSTLWPQTLQVNESDESCDTAQTWASRAVRPTLRRVYAPGVVLIRGWEGPPLDPDQRGPAPHSIVNI